MYKKVYESKLYIYVTSINEIFHLNYFIKLDHIKDGPKYKKT